MIDAVAALVNRGFEFVGHVQTLGRANRGSINTITAFEHVDVKTHEMLANRVAGRGFSEIFGGFGFHRIDVDAIDRTNARAFEAADAIIEIHEQLLAGAGRQIEPHVGILQSGRLTKHVIPGFTHADEHGDHTPPDVEKILAHTG
jgi:hypothetical protein